MNRSDCPFVFAVLTSLVLSACDSGTSGVGTPHAGSAQTRLTGHVLNDEGPLLQARIEAKDADGSIVAKAEVNEQSTYVLTIPPGVNYPLILTATSDSAPNETLKAAVADPGTVEQDISPITTIVVDTALSLGGLTEGNLAKAAGAAIAQRKKSGGGSGGSATSQSFKGDPTKQYGGWH